MGCASSPLLHIRIERSNPNWLTRQKRKRVSAYARKLDVQARGCLHDGSESLQRSEQGGIRPAIVVQNDDGNFYSNVLLVVPLTTQIKKRNMPTHFILHNRFLSAPSMAICERPRPADKSRVLSYLGHLSKYEMRQVSVCCNTALGSLDTSHSENTLRLLRRRMFSPLQKSCSPSSFRIFGC